MKSTFTYTLDALLPILMIVVLGHIVRQIGPWKDDFFMQLNKLCFYIFMPIQLFYNIYSIESFEAANWWLIVYLLASVFLCLVIGLVAARIPLFNSEQQGVIVQATFRSNQALLGIPLANALGGIASVPFTSLATSFCVPLFNVLAVVTLTVFSGNERSRISARSLIRRIVSNPLIISALSGLILVALRQFLPVVGRVSGFDLRVHLPTLYQGLATLSAVASPVMLFVLGARLDFRMVSGLMPQIILGVLLRLIVCPTLVIGVAVALREPLGLTVVEMPTLIAISATPTAVASAIMVREIGGDDQLASQLVVWTSVLSLVSVFCIVYLLRTWGLL